MARATPGTIAAMPQSDRPMEPHLGEVIGAIAPMQPIRRVIHRNPRWIEDGTNLIIAWIATAVFGLLGALCLWMAFTFSGNTPLE